MTDDFNQGGAAAQFLMSQTSVASQDRALCWDRVSADLPTNSPTPCASPHQYSIFPRINGHGARRSDGDRKGGQRSQWRHAVDGCTYTRATRERNHFPMRVFDCRNIRAGILTNAAAASIWNTNRARWSCSPNHINLQGHNPLVGPNDERFGTRFPDMTYAYCKALSRTGTVAAKKGGKKPVTRASMAAVLGAEL